MTKSAMTTTQVAARLGVSRQAVLWMVKHGKLQPEQKLPEQRGPYLFTPSSVEALAAERAPELGNQREDSDA